MRHFPHAAQHAGHIAVPPQRVVPVLEALRSLLLVGWDAGALLAGLAAVVGVGAVSLLLALAALRGRLSPD